MDKFGEAVKTLRGSRKAIQIARNALGPDAPLPQLRSLASYLGRIERGELQNPTSDVLTKVAKGLGVTLAEFFALLQGVPTVADPHPQNVSVRPGPSVVESDTPPGTDSSNGAQVPPNAFDTATLAAAILEAASHIASACDRLATAVAAATEHGALHRQAATPRPQSPKRRRADPGRVRKSA